MTGGGISTSLGHPIEDKRGTSNGTRYLRKLARSSRNWISDKLTGQQSETESTSSANSEKEKENSISDKSNGISSAHTDTEKINVKSANPQFSLTADTTDINLKLQVTETFILKMFSTISSLKSAYRQLQSAHAPYDLDKIRKADKAVVAELERVSELKRSYRKILDVVSLGQSEQRSEAPTQIGDDKKEVTSKTYVGRFNNFQDEIDKKNAELNNLRDLLAQATAKNEKLERRMKRSEHKLPKDPLNNPPKDLSPTPQLLEHVLLRASEASRGFAKLLMSFMQVAQWDLNAAANSIVPNINYAKSADKKFAFESYVNHRMLSGFENENFHVNAAESTAIDPEKTPQQCFKEFHELRSADVLDVITSDPQGNFAKYCLHRFLDIVHQRMEESFFGNLEHRDQVSAGIHPKSQFYQDFLKLAKAMWILHRLAYSFLPKARIFQVQRGTGFSPLYMDNVTRLSETDMNNSNATWEVAFTVVPGLRVDKTIIKCQVYVVAAPVSDS
ncbi:hypothetical protein KP509_11G049300 [Ceratopteris richardii]|nr:hypothetical protein KP509_11G049300 [Ceratopteris richardii]KAH7425324.1 hypothetical protein KP509_11G049300 [Ceratopteris richardii]